MLIITKKATISGRRTIVISASLNCQYLLLLRYSLSLAQAASLLRFLDHTIRHTHSHKHTHTQTGSTPLDEWSARRKDRTYTTHNKYKRRKSRPIVRFEPAIPAIQLPQTAWPAERNFIRHTFYVRTAAAWLLRSRVRVPLRACKFFCCFVLF